MKILHVLETSLPRLAGYTIRAKYIIENQLKNGLKPIVITSPLHGKTTRSFNDFEEIDSIRYYRTGEFNQLDMTQSLPIRLWKRYLYSKNYQKAIQWVVKREKVDIIHSHSSYLNGIRANEAAKALGIPSIYEVRGFWQDTAEINAQISKTHWKYRFIEYMDKKAMLEADKVVTISYQMEKEIIEKGIKENKLFVVPNGVDTQHFVPRQKNDELETKYGLKGKFVFGFIGSIRKIEGLSLFLKNLNKIIEKHKETKVLLIGDGEEVDELKHIAKSKNLSDFVVFTGRIDHEQILDFYSLVDAFIYPRINAKVNHKVTPLKPLEAMAMEKIVIVSDVGGLAELVEEGKNGLIFKTDDGESLVQKCLSVVQEPQKWTALRKNARKWTIEQRDWSNVIKTYHEEYVKLLAIKK